MRIFHKISPKIFVRILQSFHKIAKFLHKYPKIFKFLQNFIETPSKILSTCCLPFGFVSSLRGFCQFGCCSARPFLRSFQVLLNHLHLSVQSGDLSLSLRSSSSLIFKIFTIPFKILVFESYLS